MSTRWIRANGVTCAASPDGNDLALCGAAARGEGDDLGEVLHERSAGNITCPQCCTIIGFVRDELRRAHCIPEGA